MWFKRKLEKKKRLESLRKGKEKDAAWKKKKKKRKSIEQMETGGSTPLVFPLERLNLNWKKKGALWGWAKKNDEWENFRQTEVTGECKEKTVEMRT